MKLSLVVLTPGKQEGKAIDIKLPQFLVGRDPQCHLRPASPLISKRHCVLTQREGKAFLRDFDSTNGTAVNDQPVKGEVELHHNDRLKIGPLLFAVRLEAGAPATGRTPVPPTRPASQIAAAIKPADATPAPPGKAETKAAAASSGSGDEEDIAAMLLSLQDDSDINSSGPLPEIPDGTTVMDLKVPTALEQPAAPGEQDKEKAKKAASGNTQSAAKSILEKMMRRNRP